MHGRILKKRHLHQLLKNPPLLHLPIMRGHRPSPSNPQLNLAKDPRQLSPTPGRWRPKHRLMRLFPHLQGLPGSTTPLPLTTKMAPSGTSQKRLRHRSLNPWLQPPSMVPSGPPTPPLNNSGSRHRSLPRKVGSRPVLHRPHLTSFRNR